ncbi:ankyrin repeat domain-containing protein [Reichenbachiella carrageenanivorans]|uniref:Ankyrin repeat domain-containing protein n=1 Tax=Reichenbachiella carrageenanivorans TaxID=2979869 RepID=A0ABY6CWM8_9BACT|nr:ankyrin repeat domain-containing protein [Reichenbachiella carrageenanivorans]UXX77749.1 ankyrin repeat domain-containing protein [Reichenbachiella carrageenanivorans]
MKWNTEDLFDASLRGEVQNVKQILNTGVNPDAMGSTGLYPIHATITLYKKSNEKKKLLLEILKILISHGADLNVKTKPGYTACHLAAMSNNLEALKLLIENGADKDIRDPYGNTLLTTAVASFDGDDSIVKYLLDLGMDPLVENNRGNNLLNGLDMPRKDPIRHLFEKWL